MDDEKAVKELAGKNKFPLGEKELRGFKYLRGFIPLLQRFHLVKDHHNRVLHYDQYLSLIIFSFFNPIISSLRAIQQVSTLQKVQKFLGVKAASLGALSEASHVFDAHRIAPLLKELARRAIPVERNSLFKSLQQTLVAVDGTLLPALPKMLWALWLDDDHRAAKLHLEFDIAKHIPTRIAITDANANEKQVCRTLLAPDKLYVLDAGYAQYRLLQEIKTAGSSFVVRLRDNAVWDTLEQRPLTDNDQKAGVTRDSVACLGSQSKKDSCPSPVRIIEIAHKGHTRTRRTSRVSSKKTFRTRDSDYTLLLVTDRMDLPAELIALMYRYRWQIELFFRWLKCVLGCKHLLALSENGVSIQIYCALIASMLITLWTGRKPTKRTFEMVAFYFMGWANDEELARHIARLKTVEENMERANV